MHSEPINTAAGIADVRVIPITSKNRANYHRVLEKSLNIVFLQVKSAHSGMNRSAITKATTVRSLTAKAPKKVVQKQARVAVG